MFNLTCTALEADEIIKNSEVFCTQAANNNDETYCECLQAQECVDNSGDIYFYKTGEDIIDVYSYTVSCDQLEESTWFRRITIGVTLC